MLVSQNGGPILRAGRAPLLITEDLELPGRESLLLVEDKVFALQSIVPYQSAAAELAHSSSSAKIIKLPFVGSEVAD